MLIQNSTNSAPMPSASAANSGAVGIAPQPLQAGAAQPAAPQPSPAQVQQEVGRINAALQRANKNLELNISVDETTKKQVIKLTDKDTGDTLLQYPSDAVLAIARGIDQFQHGLLLKQKA